MSLSRNKEQSNTWHENANAEIDKLFYTINTDSDGASAEPHEDPIACESRKVHKVPNIFISQKS